MFKTDPLLCTGVIPGMYVFMLAKMPRLDLLDYNYQHSDPYTTLNGTRLWTDSDKFTGQPKPWATTE